MSRIGSYLSRLRQFLYDGASPAQFEDEEPLRSELFSAGQMAQYGETLARSHTVARIRGRDKLLPRLALNEQVLVRAGRLLADALKADRRITPAGEWLLDNFYLIDEQIRTSRRHLPKRYSWALPRLVGGGSAGLPRVYDIALEAISHGDGRVDEQSLSLFIAAYQKITPLKLGELWAIPIMLRLALIENLRRVASRIATDRTDRNLADLWADQMIEVAEKDPKNLILVIADMARSQPPMVGSFVAELTRRLQGQSHALALPLTWIEQQLAEFGLTIEQLIQSENQQQATDQISISNSIGSLRFLASMDWSAFVESMSVTEKTLYRDPAGTYAKMDFATRDCYRHVIENMARRGRIEEEGVARKAIDLAQTAAATRGSGDRASHVGFYLVDDGLQQLEQAAGLRLSLRRLHIDAPSRLLIYLGAISLVTLLLALGLTVGARSASVHGWLLAATGLLSLIGASQLALLLVNRLATMLLSPRALPSMDFSGGIPAICRTLVVVPTMLRDAGNVDALVEAMEVRFLANRDPSLHFGLLTDFADAGSQTMPGDDMLMNRATAAIQALNARYGNDAGDIFFLFHRPRRWNERERVWMGYERKRGKLGDLNALLREGTRTNFLAIAGDTQILSTVKYVVTLDTDTQLPRDSARSLVAAMAHPLNRPGYAAGGRRVGVGHGILQPRVAATLASANRSRYAKMHAGEVGIDPYTRTVSDVYQDAFGEGSFIGKGIYDVEAFEHVLKDCFPENRILSHDLLEGCYARSGLLSDVELYEDYPSRYGADVARRHRWIRGDWQIAGWLLARVPGANGQRLRNPLSLLSQWKILDNLRRSLVPAALVLLLILGWSVLPRAWLWTLAVMSVALLPPCAAMILDISRKPDETTLVQHLRAVTHASGRRFFSAIFQISCLPHEAYSNLDAIVRTLVRMLFTHRHPLQWTPSNEVERNADVSLRASIRAMWIAPALVFGVAMLLIAWRPHVLALALPVLLLWLVSPLLTWWLSRDLGDRHAEALTVADTQFLREIARRTWAFFEDLVGSEDHWLPPDNIQEIPAPAVAHRTSPTNIGMALLANLSAHDFGYIGTGALIERTGNTLATMQGLAREHGHFYNWYDTRTLQALHPVYISTVDSGNLAAHLLTLQAGLLELGGQPVVGAQVFSGLRDTAAILRATRIAVPSDVIDRFERRIDALTAQPPALFAVEHALCQLHADAEEINDRMVAAGAIDGQHWAEALLRQCRDAVDDLRALAPWLTLPRPPGRLAGSLDGMQIPALRSVADAGANALANLQMQASAEATAEELEWIAAFGREVAKSAAQVGERVQALHRLGLQACEMAQMDFGFLYDPARHLFSIGYNVTDRRLDASYYDLLASEARLASFLAIAQGRIPQENWYSLGRLLTQTSSGGALLSWSGSMFEYLMPLLVMPTYRNSLLDQSYIAAVDRQIAYARDCGVPWGISESGYNAVDAALNYQYRAFGVPGLGLKRGLSEDLVIAPYAAVLALMVAPKQACRNLMRLATEGVLGRFGFYEAVDYTPARLPRGETSAKVQSFMVHHQGMSLLATDYALLDRPMQRRFVSVPLFQATLHLLQERIPRAAASSATHAEMVDVRAAAAETTEMPIRVFDSAGTPIPGVQLLSNGRYHVMLTNAGGGYSRWKDVAVTRWREDVTCDNWGMFCFVRDIDANKVWSTAFQPILAGADAYEATFTEPKVEFHRRDDQIETQTDIAVSPEDDIELRRVRLINRSRVRKTIELTSYAEVVLVSQAADAMQRGFNNLFVQTEILGARQAIVCTRRPRSDGEQPPWMLHVMKVRGAESLQTSYETDRMRFIGRGRTLADPVALVESAPLSGTQGSVLDPIVAIRHRVVLEPDQTLTIDIVCGVAENRESCLGLIDKYQDKALADRVFDLAWTHSQVALRQINVTEADAQLYGRIASRIIYANSSLRADASVIASNRRSQPGLWGYAISGDLPILLLKIRDSANIGLARQLVQAHAYWRMKGLAVDLVIWNDDRGGYRQLLHDQIVGLLAAGIEANMIDRPGGIFVRPVDQISPEDRVLLQAVARVVISDERGALIEQVKRRDKIESVIPRFTPTRTERVVSEKFAAERIGVERSGEPLTQTQLFNGLGGFSADGTEYVVTTSAARRTPLPWVNVLANPQFGTVVSESGAAYTWAENAHEYRLTPWHADPVSDPTGEAFYLRDEETGQFWSPTPAPACGANPYVVRHGFGYSVFEHVEAGIQTELWVYVALDLPVKFCVLKVRNVSAGPRRLSVTGYVEWTLGDVRAKTAMHVVSEIDQNNGALLARNAFNTEFSDRVAFFDVDDPTRTITGDRSEFIGRNGNLKNPAVMQRARLSGKVGAGMDPCAAIQVPFELAEGKSRELIFRLGAGRDFEHASELVQLCRKAGTARDALDAVRAYWKRTLGVIRVQTPDASLNLLANGWLVYQAIASRIWGRSGYYQSGGAWGFRDQLQDVMALAHCEPGMLRAQLLLCASRQFKQGDVQHWWHPPSGRGVRTLCSDDYLWLPFAACRYVVATGDFAVLQERIAFLDGRPLGEGEESYYDLPTRLAETATLYEHCQRAIVHGLRFGEHGLPLMGSGDWNDGMNNVGIHGKGESVWLAFFLYDVLMQFADVATRSSDAAFAERCRTEAERLRANVEKNAWDGGWYRRAYFDDGTPLGSASNDECQIDSISQSWAVLSGAGSAERVATAMQAVDRRLVRRDDALIQLLDPPFDKSTMDPGYIKGYVPGVRENGGQYTHAAVWTAMAFAALGDADRAHELLAMINPLNHADSAEKLAVYKTEPYVVAADIYAVVPHVGRGGWTWYTGSAGWLYRLIVESIIGLRLNSGKLLFAPCLPAAWESLQVAYRRGDAVYDIEFRRVAQGSPGVQITLDGVLQTEECLTMVDDGTRHHVVVNMPAASVRIAGNAV
ncbi:MAG: glucoamylase family protein [Rudaea sp.]|nr:glucoamylase family protein [Rudaea sp.]